MRLPLLFLCISTTSSLNFVLYLTLIGKSHLDFVNAMVNALSEKGHNVDVVAGILGVLSIDGQIKAARSVTSFTFNKDNPWSKAVHLNNPFDMSENVDMGFFFRTISALGKIGLESGIPVDFMKNGHYNAAIVSDYDYFGYVFARAAGITKVMSFVSTSLMVGQTINVGLPNPISCTAVLFDNDEPDWSLWYKITHLYKYGKYIHFSYPKVAKSTDKIVRKHFGPDFPPVLQLARNSDLVFSNGHELTDVPRTITHKIKYIGGLGLRKPKPVTKEFDEMLNLKENGTVLVSFGTQVPPQNFNIRVKKALVNSFKKFPRHLFIWKYSLQPGDETLFNGVNNVKLVDWLPQTDLLCEYINDYISKLSDDQRVVGFITHSGLNSMHEYTHAGVPVVSIPLFADQAHNSRNVVRLGVGITVDKLTMDEIIVTEALEQILNNQTIIHQAKHLAALLAGHPETAKERFVKWVEFAATYENLHQQYNLMEANMSVVSYYCIDVICILLSAVLSAFIIMKRIISWLFKPQKKKLD